MNSFVQISKMLQIFLSEAAIESIKQYSLENVIFLNFSSVVNLDGIVNSPTSTMKMGN